MGPTPILEAGIREKAGYWLNSHYVPRFTKYNDVY